MNIFNFFKKNKVRARFAPSPTGTPHIGNIRTALFAWLFAKHHNGTFVLRIEDTDQSRKDDKSVSKILESLAWLGMNIDEGVISEEKETGKYGPYFQSKRLDIYKKYSQELIESGKAYYCFCDAERLAKLKEDQIVKKMPAKYDGHCLDLNKKIVQQNLDKNMSYVIRMVVPKEGQTVFTDAIRGEIKVENKLIDHQIIIKSDGFPTYHLAVVVDDYLMGITHILRAEEWLPSTPKHVLLYKYLGWNLPEFIHLPVVLASDKTKLSKRHGATSVLEFRDQGYLPQALLNFLALLGWNPKNNKEIFSKQDLIKEFDIKKINKNSPIFDVDKLNWLNSQYIKNLPTGDIVILIKSLVSDKLRDKDDVFLKKSVDLVKDRMEKLTDYINLTQFLQKPVSCNPDILVAKKSNKHEAKKMLQESLDIIKNTNNWTEENLKNTFFAYIESNFYKKGEMLWPLRVAVTGLEKSPDVFGSMDVLGKKEIQNRLENAIRAL